MKWSDIAWIVMRKSQIWVKFIQFSLKMNNSPMITTPELARKIIQANHSRHFPFVCIRSPHRLKIVHYQHHNQQQTERNTIFEIDSLCRCMFSSLTYSIHLPNHRNQFTVRFGRNRYVFSHRARFSQTTKKFKNCSVIRGNTRAQSVRVLYHKVLLFFYSVHSQCTQSS